MPSPPGQSPLLPYNLGQEPTHSTPTMALTTLSLDAYTFHLVTSSLALDDPINDSGLSRPAR